MSKKYRLILAAALTVVTADLTARAAASKPASLPVDPANPPRGVFADEWYAVMVDGRKCGCMHTRLERMAGKGADLIQTWTKIQLALRRDQVEVSVGIEQKTTETLDGRPLNFLRTLYLGKQPLVTEGTVENGRVTLVTKQFNQAAPPQHHPYPAGALMEWGIYREQFRRGLNPGTKYDVLVYEPSIAPDRGCKTTVEILSRETIDLFGRKVEAAKARQTMQIPQTLPGSPATQETTLWVTEDGDVLRLEMSIMNISIEVLACSKAVALADNDPAELMIGTLVQLNGPIDAERAQRITYRIELKNPDDKTPLPRFPETGMQKVTDVNRTGATVTVTRPSPNSSQSRSVASDTEMVNRYLAASATINFKDPKVAELARQAADGETDPRKLADKLSRFVADYVESKTLGVGFATASEVARSREGDCTEHGVLLAALGRANKVPSRIVTGLVYTEDFGGRPNVLVGHLWTQFWIDGGWVDVDSALRQHTHIDATHIAMSIGAATDDGFADLVASTWLSLGRFTVTVIQVDVN